MIKRFATDAFWSSNSTVYYNTSSEYSKVVSKAMTPGKAAGIVLLSVFAALVVLGTVVHIFSFGDKDDYKEKKLDGKEREFR